MLLTAAGEAIPESSTKTGFGCWIQAPSWLAMKSASPPLERSSASKTEAAWPGDEAERDCSKRLGEA